LSRLAPTKTDLDVKLGFTKIASPVEFSVDNIKPVCYRFAYWVVGLVPRIKTGG
jgi:hypothetical protein